MCKQDLALDSFKANARRSDGLQSQCIECHKKYRREHYEKNKKKYIDKASVWKKDFVKWWKEYKRTFTCGKCGENHPACIDFHHTSDNKENNVSQLVAKSSKEILMKEIAKCIPICANCHRKLHWKE